MKYLKEYCEKFNLNYSDIKNIIGKNDDSLFSFMIRISPRYIDKMKFYITKGLTFGYEYERELINSIKTDLYTFSSLKDGLTFYKKQIEHNICNNYSTSSLENNQEKVNEAKKLIQIIDELLPILKEDLGSKEYDNCIEFIETDLYEVCKTLNIERFYKDCVLGFEFNNCKIIISNSIKDGERFSCYDKIISLDSLDVSLEIMDEGIMFKRTVSTFEEFKTTFRKIISLLEDKDEYKDFCIKLEKIL